MNQSKPNSIGTEVKPNANETAKCKCCNYSSAEKISGQTNKHVLFFAGGPDALNDLKFVSGVESLSVYHMPKSQISETKKILIFFS